MTKKQDKKTEKAVPSIYRLLLPSFLMVIVCLLFFVGTSYAWFTASENNTGNQIKSGKMQVETVAEYEAASSTVSVTVSFSPRSGGWKQAGAFSVSEDGDVVLKVSNTGSVNVAFMVYAEADTEHRSPIALTVNAETVSTALVNCAQTTEAGFAATAGNYEIVCVNALAVR